MWSSEPTRTPSLLLYYEPAFWAPLTYSLWYCVCSVRMPASRAAPWRISNRMSAASCVRWRLYFPLCWWYVRASISSARQIVRSQELQHCLLDRKVSSMRRFVIALVLQPVVSFAKYSGYYLHLNEKSLRQKYYFWSQYLNDFVRWYLKCSLNTISNSFKISLDLNTFWYTLS